MGSTDGPLSNDIRTRRKIFHLLLGTLFILSMIAYWPMKWFFLAVLTTGVILSFVQERRNLPVITWFLDRYDKKDDPIPGQGPLTFFFGAVLTWFLFPHDIAIIGLIVLTFGDPLAYLGGLSIGGPKLQWNPDKRWVGLICFMIVPIVIITLLFGPISAIVATMIGTIVESIKWPHRVITDDNVVIPLITSLGLFLILFIL